MVVRQVPTQHVVSVSFDFVREALVVFFSSGDGRTDGRTCNLLTGFLYCTPAAPFCIRQHQLAIDQEDEDWRRRRNLGYEFPLLGCHCMHDLHVLT